MPELPEVEVTRLGITRDLVGNKVTAVAVHSAKLRSMVPPELPSLITGETVQAVERRGKYLILRFPHGSLLLHLGMTGHLRVLPAIRSAGPHDHLDIRFDSGVTLRFNDVRRFGSIHWTATDPLHHTLLAGIGPEPLTDTFSGDYLYRRSRGRSVAVQRLLMDGAIVAGIGNIYAAESLFRSAILPTTPAGHLSPSQCATLVASIRRSSRPQSPQGGPSWTSAGTRGSSLTSRSSSTSTAGKGSRAASAAG